MENPSLSTVQVLHSDPVRMLRILLMDGHILWPELVLQSRKKTDKQTRIKEYRQTDKNKN